jgi:UDPglucose 6-dehydrogenase
VPLSVLEAVEEANERQKHVLFQKLSKALGGNVAGAKVAIWGLAFKPQTDDMREAPSLTLIEELLAAKATVCAHDPVAEHEARRRLDQRVAFADTNYEAVAGADALVIVTDWNEYRHPDFQRVKQALKQPILIDGRNLYDPDRMRTLGFIYDSIGRAR